MAPAKMSLQADEELGKKDDDHRLPEPGRFRSIQSSATLRPRRILILIVVCVLVYQFFKHMPTDLTPAAERYNPTITKLRPPKPASPGGSFQSPAIPKNDKPKLSNSKILETYDKDELYGDKIKFYNLAQSLPSQKYPMDQASNAVLFAGSNLRSISDFLPLACEMARTKLNGVHVVLLGRDEVSIEGIKQVNGISDSECPMTWHGQSTLFELYSLISLLTLSLGRWSARLCSSVYRHSYGTGGGWWSAFHPGFHCSRSHNYPETKLGRFILFEWIRSSKGRKWYSSYHASHCFPGFDVGRISSKPRSAR